MTRRISRHDIMMMTAQVVAQRSTCSRLSVGAVIAIEGRVVSLGYNGVPSKMIHCFHAPGGDEPCLLSVHAEANAIVFAARNGVKIEGAELYVTHQPCLECAKLIVNSGIKKVRYLYPYRSESGKVLLEKYGLIKIYFENLDVRLCFDPHYPDENVEK